MLRCVPGAECPGAAELAQLRDGQQLQVPELRVLLRGGGGGLELGWQMAG